MSIIIEYLSTGFTWNQMIGKVTIQSDVLFLAHLRGWYFIQKGISNLQKASLKKMVTPLFWQQKMNEPLPPLHLTPIQAKISLKLVLEWRNNTLSMIFLWLRTFWSKILWSPQFFLSKHLWLFSTCGTPFRRKGQPLN